MTDYQKLYEEKRMTPEDAAGMLSSNEVCASDIALSQSYLFYDAVQARVAAGELENIDQHCMLTTKPPAFFTEEGSKNYHGISWYSNGVGRKAINQGWGDIMPSYYRDWPQLFTQYVHPETFVAVVSPMDKHGYFTTGTTCSATTAIRDGAKRIFLEVNPRMPRTLSSTLIHISQVTGLWEHEAPLDTLPPTVIDEVSAKIGGYIAEEVPDGATLQLGIGTIPDAVGMGLTDKHHLGIHTEMFTDSLMKLLDCGAADNSRKPIHTGKTVATFALGSQRMYDYMDDNPAFEMLPVNYVNDPATISQHPNFISINAGLEVDFYGQVCAESIGTKHISGTGGQADYVRGATQSKGGKSFIAFTSTAMGGTVSRIRPTLTTGAIVTTHKNDVDNIVTEYGIAKLRGRPLSQRVKNLIAIAHPKFRDELTFEAKKQNIII